MTSWFAKLAEEDVSQGLLHHRLHQVKKLATTHSGKPLEEFLKSEVSFDKLEEPLDNLNLTRSILLGGTKNCSLIFNSSKITLNVVFLLQIFRNRENLSYLFVVKWVHFALKEHVSESKVRHKVESVLSKLRKLKSSQSTELSTFLN